MIFLTSNLECCQEDSGVLVSVLHAFLHRLKLGQDDELDDKAIDEMVVRNEQKEVFLLYLRFFNILMSRRKVKGEDVTVRKGQAYVIPCWMGLRVFCAMMIKTIIYITELCDD